MPQQQFKTTKHKSLRNRTVSANELTALLSPELTQNAPQMREIIQLAIHSGMALSEICNLSWADVDKSNHTILIRQRKSLDLKVSSPTICAY